MLFGRKTYKTIYMVWVAPCLWTTLRGPEYDSHGGARQPAQQEGPAVATHATKPRQGCNTE